jgi:carbon-monoxide dehydrogenase large subunit
MDYAVPAAADCPPVDVEALELSPSPSNPLGAKGAGEAGTAGAGAALANAVAAALSHRVEITELPLTATRLFPLIEKAFA